MIDAHLHVEMYPDEELESLIETWREGGIESVVAVSTGLRSSYRTLELQVRYPDFVRAAVGMHPEYPVPPERDVTELLALIRQERHRLVAVGEVGLPHYEVEKLGAGALEAWTELLGTFAETAREHDLPLVLHAVHNKAPLAFQALQRHGVTRAHFHWLKAAPDDLQQILDAGYYVSVTPDVCHRERDQRLASLVPLPQLLLETDGPWPHEGPVFGGRRTTPLFLQEMVGPVARLKHLMPEELVRRVRGNTAACYRFEPRL
ncbi:TatD family hydrolase [Tumebacillus flagellatus]|uniref:Uncharacterized protein n=1 Tax=Tumebacillus flagellatus TaxID=1157490 RepID=A0A074LU56_9BACL|nr:TatD family hydrolase [Tumebacillus flagellatus]KEO83458.1 hypothetical protein EL26_09570 [Tumebacillus flagellatus]